MKRLLMMAVLAASAAFDATPAAAQCMWGAACESEINGGSWRHKFVSGQGSMYECNCESCCHGSWDSQHCAWYHEICYLEEQEQEQLDLVLASYENGTLEFGEFNALRETFQAKLVMDDETGEVFVLGCNLSVAAVLLVDAEWIAALRAEEQADG